MQRIPFLSAATLFVLIACTSPASTPTLTRTPTRVPTVTPSPSPTRVSTVRPTPAPTATPTPLPLDFGPKVIPVDRASETHDPRWLGGQYVPVMRGSDAEAHYADPDVIALPSGGYRLYVESRGAHQIVSFFSPDGTSWTREAGVRISEAAFPDVVLLPEGRIRLYFQQFSQEHRVPVIKSAVSTDGGLTFSLDPGVRVPPRWHDELDPDGVASSSTGLLPDGHYRMYYLGVKRDNEYANGVKVVILSARSANGLEWIPENGIRLAPEDWVAPIPPRPDLGQKKRSYVDGPEAVMADNGGIKLYFWGICNGICLSVSQDGLNFRQVEQVFANHQLPVVGNAGDPALVKLEGDIWLLFYNSVQNGYANIFSARRRPL